MQARTLAIWAGITVLLALAGVTAMIYPDAAAWVSTYNQSKITASYSRTIAVVKPDAETQLEQAAIYNQALTSGVLLGANERLPQIENPHQAPELSTVKPYAQQLRANNRGLMARLRIPKIKLDLPIYHGTADETLLEGAGHLQGTALPVGGPGTRTVITAHRGLAQATMFTNLDQVTTGDQFTIEVFGKAITYQVNDVQVIEPHETEKLAIKPGKDLATLVTCTPLGINSHRIIVTGERVLPTPEKVKQEIGKPAIVLGFPWWAVWLGLSYVAGISGYIYILIRIRRAQRDHKEDGPGAQPGPPHDGNGENRA